MAHRSGVAPRLKDLSPGLSWTSSHPLIEKPKYTNNLAKRYHAKNHALPILFDPYNLWPLTSKTALQRPLLATKCCVSRRVRWFKDMSQDAVGLDAKPKPRKRAPRFSSFRQVLVLLECFCLSCSSCYSFCWCFLCTLSWSFTHFSMLGRFWGCLSSLWKQNMRPGSLAPSWKLLQASVALF